MKIRGSMVYAGHILWQERQAGRQQQGADGKGAEDDEPSSGTHASKGSGAGGELLLGGPSDGHGAAAARAQLLEPEPEPEPQVEDTENPLAGPVRL